MAIRISRNGFRTQFTAVAENPEATISKIPHRYKPHTRPHHLNHNYRNVPGWYLYTTNSIHLPRYIHRKDRVPWIYGKCSSLLNGNTAPAADHKGGSPAGLGRKTAATIRPATITPIGANSHFQSFRFPTQWIFQRGQFGRCHQWVTRKIWISQHTDTPIFCHFLTKLLKVYGFYDYSRMAFLLC